jgi:hypothetical protein
MFAHEGTIIIHMTSCVVLKYNSDIIFSSALLVSC